MHSFLIGLAYMAMVFAPCAVAQWGDVLMKPYFGIEFLQALFAPSRKRRVSIDPLLAMMQSRAEAAEMAALYSAAFTAPVHLPPFRRAAPETFAEAMNRKPKSAEAIEKAAAQVAARLGQLVEAHRLVNSVNMQQETVQEAVQALVPAAAPEDIMPTYAELESLYTLEHPAIPLTLFSNVADPGQILHFLPALAVMSPPPPSQSLPIAVAA